MKPSPAHCCSPPSASPPSTCALWAHPLNHSCFPEASLLEHVLFVPCAVTHPTPPEHRPADPAGPLGVAQEPCSPGGCPGLGGLRVLTASHRARGKPYTQVLRRRHCAEPVDPHVGSWACSRLRRPSCLARDRRNRREGQAVDTVLKTAWAPSRRVFWGPGGGWGIWGDNTSHLLQCLPSLTWGFVMRLRRRQGAQDLGRISCLPRGDPGH